jgi:hypothetical protein
MKKLSAPVLAALFVLSVFLTAFGAATAQADSNDFYKSLDYRKLFDIMKDFQLDVSLWSDQPEYTIEPFSDEDFILLFIDWETKPWILLEDNDTKLEFYILLMTNNTDRLQRTNTWNKDHFYGRAYIDENGHPVLEYQLNIADGVTEARLREFFRTCLMSFESWKRDVVD